jgi:hypothetical protein
MMTVGEIFVEEEGMDVILRMQLSVVVLDILRTQKELCGR